MKANWKKVGVDPGPTLSMWAMVVCVDDNERCCRQAWCHVTPDGDYYFLADVPRINVTHWDYMPGLPEEE